MRLYCVIRYVAKENIGVPREANLIKIRRGHHGSDEYDENDAELWRAD
jgi:hypothetical protein